MRYVLGIDASTAGSGGGKRHLIELLNNFNPDKHGFTEIKIWGVKSLLNQLPESNNIKKITHKFLNKGLPYRIFWQLFIRDAMVTNECDVLFSPFGTYTGKIKPYVSMSRNMLVFDNKERERFGISWLRLKLKLLYYKQVNSFRSAQGIIFLSKYAKRKVGEAVNIEALNTAIIHHGVSDAFNNEVKQQQDLSLYSFDKPFKFLYVSTVWVYKHPWNVIQAVRNLRDRGLPIALDFVGNNEQKSAGLHLKAKMAEVDPRGEFIKWYENVGLNEVSNFYKEADCFVFASTCENMPNILIEAMSSGLPIACSSYEPMPEFLKDGGVYFDPTDIHDIEETLEKLLHAHETRCHLANKSSLYANEYSWSKCADQTFSFLQDVINLKTLKHV